MGIDDGQPYLEKMMVSTLESPGIIHILFLFLFFGRCRHPNKCLCWPLCDRRMVKTISQKCLFFHMRAHFTRSLLDICLFFVTSFPLNLCLIFINNMRWQNILWKWTFCFGWSSSTKSAHLWNLCMVLNSSRSIYKKKKEYLSAGVTRL